MDRRLSSYINLNYLPSICFYVECLNSLLSFFLINCQLVIEGMKCFQRKIRQLGSSTTIETSKDLKLGHLKVSVSYVDTSMVYIQPIVQRFTRKVFFLNFQGNSQFPSRIFHFSGYMFNSRSCFVCKLIILSLGSIFVAEIQA